MFWENWNRNKEKIYLQRHQNYAQCIGVKVRIKNDMIGIIL